jgi:hypothetical protein
VLGGYKIVRRLFGNGLDQRAKNPASFERVFRANTGTERRSEQQRPQEQAFLFDQAAVPF